MPKTSAKHPTTSGSPRNNWDAGRASRAPLRKSALYGPSQNDGAAYRTPTAR